MFKRMHMAVQEYKTIKDKTTRLMERQIDFEDKKIFFAVNQWTEKLVEQLLAFPNGEHDDRIDALLLSMQKPSKKLFISSI